MAPDVFLSPPASEPGVIEGITTEHFYIKDSAQGDIQLARKYQREYLAWG